MEKETIPTCVDCGTQNCKYKDRTYPDFCPTDNLKEEDRQWALERYDEGRNREIMIAGAEVEYEGYCQWTRVQEIMEFARKIGAHRIGIANCIGLIREARIFARILRANGFEAYSVICKVAGQPKTSMGIPAQCESIGAAMCNPILQARLLNEAHTDLNVVIGLCVGHDSLFYKYSDAYVTTLVTKDRVTGNNPTAALYTADSYYRKKFFWREIKFNDILLYHATIHRSMLRVSSLKFTPTFITFRPSEAKAEAYPFSSICCMASSAVPFNLNSIT